MNILYIYIYIYIYSLFSNRELREAYGEVAVRVVVGLEDQLSIVVHLPQPERILHRIQNSECTRATKPQLLWSVPEGRCRARSAAASASPRPGRACRSRTTARRVRIQCPISSTSSDYCITTIYSRIKTIQYNNLFIVFSLSEDPKHRAYVRACGL